MLTTHEGHDLVDAHEDGASALVPYVIEPDEIYIPVPAVCREPAALDSARARNAVPYVRIRRSRKRVRKIAGGVVALLSLIVAVATTATVLSARPLLSPSLPVAPATFDAAHLAPVAALEPKELPVVGGLSGLTMDALFSSSAGLSRVELVRADGRTSLALEMTGEPSRAALRTLSPTAFDVEVGPIVGDVRPELFVAATIPALRQVSIRKLTSGHRDYVQARVMLNAPGGADVRVVGRVVYVDFSPVD